MTARVDAGTTHAPAIVLVHGWAGSAAAWDPVLEHWSGSSPMIPVALPGSPGAETALPHTVAGAVESVRRVLDDLQGPAVVVGHSMGGQVSLLLNAWDERVVGEVVIDPAYGADPASCLESAAWADRIEAEGTAAVDSFFDEALGERLPAAVRHRVHSDVASTSPATIASYLRTEYLGPDAIGPADQAIRLVHQRRAPVLALYSTEHAASFERAHAAQATTVEVWSGSGHYLHLERPALFCKRLESWVLAALHAHDVSPSGV